MRSILKLILNDPLTAGISSSISKGLVFCELINILIEVLVWSPWFLIIWIFCIKVFKNQPSQNSPNMLNVQSACTFQTRTVLLARLAEFQKSYCDCLICNMGLSDELGGWMLLSPMYRLSKKWSTHRAASLGTFKNFGSCTVKKSSSLGISINSPSRTSWSLKAKAGCRLQI